MEVISSRESSLSAYPDYLSFLRDHREDFLWLYEFMRRPEHVPGKTRVVVGESLNQALELNHCTDAGNLRNFLQESDSKIGGSKKVRLVLLCYKESWSFDRTVLKAVAEKYAIPPTFLWAHFCHWSSGDDKDSSDEWTRDIGGGIDKPFLQSERQAWIELKTGFSDECLSALIFNHLDVGETTIVAFIRTENFRGAFRVSSICTDFPNLISFSMRSNEFSRTTATYYEALLQNLGPEAIEAANANPIEYIFPYARLLALQISSQVKYLGDGINEEEIYPDIVENMNALRESMKNLREGLAVSISSLRRHSSPSSTYRDLLRDYEDLLNYTKQREIELKDVLSHKVSLLALKESKESIRQTQIVSRLSQLAFVFIPLTFVTSCFGMNLTALGSGKGEIWVFCVIAAALTVTIILISVYSWRIAHHCSELLEENTRPVRVMLHMARYLPTETMWMALFMVSKPSKVGRYLADMGLYHLLLPNGTEYFSDSLVYKPRSNLELDEFWRTRGEHIHKFFHTHGWKQNTFRRRLMRQ